MLSEPIELGLRLGRVLIENPPRLSTSGATSTGRVAAHQSGKKKREQFIHDDSDATRQGLGSP